VNTTLFVTAMLSLTLAFGFRLLFDAVSKTDEWKSKDTPAGVVALGCALAFFTVASGTATLASSIALLSRLN